MTKHGFESTSDAEFADSSLIRGLKNTDAESDSMRIAEDRRFQALLADLSSRQQEIDSLVGNERQLYMALVAAVFTAAGAVVVATGLNVAAFGILGKWLPSMVLFLTAVLLWLPVANSQSQLTIRLNAIYIERQLVPAIRDLCARQGSTDKFQVLGWEGFAHHRLKRAPVIRRLAIVAQAMYVSVLYLPAGVTFCFYILGTERWKPGSTLTIEIIGLVVIIVEVLSSTALAIATYRSSALVD
ncbi:hypothetical protein [Arthrobacter sp. HY1533]|uniref:hypothetical protein n=1 Tax=Arthrobacter sp. HY1533 TaxID=2970919 RepID=UPI0022B9D7BC|nr:hypothetical protein [Arthrobacter sp. HY1533]